jgi:hypothetical protein
VPEDEQKPEDKPKGASAPEEKKDEGDKFRPEAIAARIDEIGEETDLDRIAREEEKKLLERKKAQKKRGGLEAAASKRLAKIGEGTVKRPSAVAAGLSPDADPLLERAARANKWIQEHRQTFGGLVAIAVLAGAGFFGFSYWEDKRNANASSLLAQALADERGRISDKADDDDDDSKSRSLYPTFKSAAERRDAALAKLRSLESKYGGTGAAILARLAEGSLLLDGGDAKGALAAYEEVKVSPLARADVEVRGRALEGVGFAHELLAQGDAANGGKELDAAASAFKEMEQLDVQGFKELGTYHQARVAIAKGEKPKAIELLKDLQKRVNEPGETHPFSYLGFVVEDRLRELDPTALPPKASKEPPLAGARGAGGAGGGLDMNDPKIQELLRQLKQKGGTPALPSPPGPSQ